MKMYRALFFYLIAVIMFVPILALGNSYYVSPTGVNTNAGTLALPFRTVQKAANVLEPGDTCYIRAGTYRESLALPRGGTSEATSQECEIVLKIKKSYQFTDDRIVPFIEKSEFSVLNFMLHATKSLISGLFSGAIRKWL